MNRSIASVLLATPMLFVSGSASADDFGQCERIQNSFEPMRQAQNLTLFRSSVGNVAGDASWPANVVGTYANAATGWTSMRPVSNPAITIATTGPLSPNGYSGISDNEIVQRYSSFRNLGTTNLYVIWPGWDIQHTDMRILGPTVSDPACMASGVPCPVLTYTTSCALGVATEAATLAHELGHAYGFDHQDDVPAMMASSQIDVLGCALNSLGTGGGQRILLDANGHLCMRRSYDHFAGFDVSISPVTATPGCNARTTACYSVVGPIRRAGTAVSGGTVFVNAGVEARILVNYTLFNNGDELVGPVNVNGVLSLDNVVDASDILVMSDLVTGAATGAGGGFVFGDTVRRALNFSLSTSEIASMNVGLNYRLLLEADGPGGAVSQISESDENNNVTDVRITVRPALKHEC